MRNLRNAAQAAAQFFERRPIRRLFLGGTSETTAEFKELLPKNYNLAWRTHSIWP
ncbi:MAG: hypothetical protein M5U34_11575 [Chloroflexi bacterium]|nr:hypothetical protein [Chloroflexota bacterium]